MTRATTAGEPTTAAKVMAAPGRYDLGKVPLAR